MKASIVQPRELDHEHLRRWQTIRTQNPALASPFFAPEFIKAIGQTRHDARVAVIEDGRDVVGYFPFHRRPLGFGRPIGLGMNDFHGSICPADTSLDGQWLLRACKLRFWSTDHLIAVQAGMLTSPDGAHESPYIDCAAGLQPYADRMRSQRRPGVGRALRKRAKLVERFGHDLNFLWHSGSSATLERLIGLKSAQCRAAGSYDYTRHAWVRALLHSLLSLKSESFSAVLSEIRVGDQTLAMHFGLQSANRLHWWLPAYESAWQSWSPGLALLLDVIEHAPEAHVTQIDLGRDLSRYKREFMTGADTVHSGTLSVDPKATFALALAARVAQLDQGRGFLKQSFRPAAGAMRRMIRALKFY